VFGAWADTDKAEVMLSHTLNPGIEYERQSDTILTWSEAETECALSFQEMEGCLQVWEHIVTALGKQPPLLPLPVAAPPVSPSAVDGTLLPLPELGNIEEIRGKLRAGSHSHRDVMIASLLQPDFVRKLYEIFTTAEDLEADASLVHLFDVRLSQCANQRIG